MDLQSLTIFFMWCTIINGGVFLYAVIVILFAPDFIYKVQARWFNISRESWNVLMYAFIGLYKVLFLIFCLVPYLALLIMA